mgnify:CR=1 FL=1
MKITPAPAFYNTGSLYRTRVNQSVSLIDSQKALFGTGSDASILYDGSKLIIKPDEVGSGGINLDGDTFVSNAHGVVIGHTAQIAMRGDTPEVQVLGTGDDDTMLGLARFSAQDDGAEIYFAKSRNASIGSFTIVDNNDRIGAVRAMADDGTDLATLIAMMDFKVDDSSPAENAIGGEINFLTAPSSGGVAIRMSIDADGDVTGTHGNYHVSSDARLKENVATISNALTKVRALRGVNFTWIDTGRKGSAVQMGLIAQEVEAVVPEVVHTQRTIDESGQVVNIADPIKSVEYPYLVGLLVEAIKELKAEVDAL